jgi:hypothetical protein
MPDTAWESRTDDRLKAIEDRLAIIERREAADEVHHANMMRRLDKIEGTLTWILRVVLGGFATGLVAFAMGGGFAL